MEWEVDTWSMAGESLLSQPDLALLLSLEIEGLLSKDSFPCYVRNLRLDRWYWISCYLFQSGSSSHKGISEKLWVIFLEVYGGAYQSSIRIKTNVTYLRLIEGDPGPHLLPVLLEDDWGIIIEILDRALAEKCPILCYEVKWSIPR